MISHSIRQKLQEEVCLFLKRRLVLFRQIQDICPKCASIQSHTCLPFVHQIGLHKL